MYQYASGDISPTTHESESGILPCCRFIDFVYLTDLVVCTDCPQRYAQFYPLSNGHSEPAIESKAFCHGMLKWKSTST